MTGIELRLLEIPQEAIAVYEAKNASQPTLSSRTISEQSAPHLTGIEFRTPETRSGISRTTKAEVRLHGHV
ncbi:hypothetical protein AB5N96_01005 [Chryseomicrobium imtechense]